VSVSTQTANAAVRACNTANVLQERRYGFNGKENDSEFGNQYDYGARMYNAQIGRWLSVDPLMAKYPEWSTYAFSANSPIATIDNSGEDWFYYMKNGESNPNWHFHAGATQLRVTAVENQRTCQTTITGFSAVVEMQGSRQEGVAGNGQMNSQYKAQVTVYTVDGRIVRGISALTMTSNSEAYTPIDEGRYKLSQVRSEEDDSRLVEGAGYSLEMKYQVFELGGSDRIRTLDGKLNNSFPNQTREVNGRVEGYKDAIFIHNTCNGNSCGGKTSTGCILIEDSKWSEFDGMLNGMGSNGLFILNRTGSTEVNKPPLQVDGPVQSAEPVRTR
jgi:RHS repeat-associated protein